MSPWEVCFSLFDKWLNMTIKTTATITLLTAVTVHSPENLGMLMEITLLRMFYT